MADLTPKASCKPDPDSHLCQNIKARPRHTMADRKEFLIDESNHNTEGPMVFEMGKGFDPRPDPEVDTGTEGSLMGKRAKLDTKGITQGRKPDPVIYIQNAVCGSEELCNFASLTPIHLMQSNAQMSGLTWSSCTMVDPATPT